MARSLTTRLAILADDFTGACDAAAPFAAAGLRTSMVLALPSDWPDFTDVLAVDLDIRVAAPAEARERMAAAALGAPPDARLFVKIDSTLRGPVAAMIDGALSGSGLEHAMVAPAFPEQGRIYQHGTLVSTGASLHDLLGPLATRCRIVDDPAAVPLDRHALFVGSAGLARHLAMRLPPPDFGKRLPENVYQGRQGPLPARWPSTMQRGMGDGPEAVREDRGAVLVAAGSPTAVTSEQLARLPPAVTVLRTSPSETRDSGEAAAQVARAVANQALQVRPGLLILVGGQTARLTCTGLGATGLRVLSEVLPGIPLGRLQGGLWHDVLVVTKAGGFGGPNTLLDVLRLVGPSCLEPA